MADMEEWRELPHSKVPNLDELPDQSLDSPRHHKLRGAMIMQQGKYAKKNMSLQAIYVSDKPYLRWVRAHINVNSALDMRTFKAYIEMRDSNKANRLTEATGSTQSAMPAIPPMPPSTMAPIMGGPPMTMMSQVRGQRASGHRQPERFEMTPTNRSMVHPQVASGSGGYSQDHFHTPPGAYRKRGADREDMEVDTRTNVMRSQAAVENWMLMTMGQTSKGYDKYMASMDQVKNMIQQNPELVEKMMVNMMRDTPVDHRGD